MAGQPRGTVTLLFTDIEGSTRLLQRLGPGTYKEVLELHRRLLREAFARHDGYEVNYEGDGFFVAFESASEAVLAATEAQQALARADWPEDGEFRVRMGVHTGEPVVVPPKYLGLDVHKAARIMAAGHGGQVLLSEATQRLLDGADTISLGEHRLKDLLRPEPLYQLRIEGQQSEFPALATLGNRPTNLPVQATPLIGREREVADAATLMRRDGVRLLTLTGPGGIGKTRLALHTAAHLLDEFPDGVFFVPLAPVRDPQLVIPAVAQTLGLREQPGKSIAETLVQHLEGMRLLLLLDNLEQVIEAAVDVAGLVQAAPGLRLLVTSREPLRVYPEHVYDVQPFALPPAEIRDFGELAGTDSVQLFASRARAAEASFALTPANATVVAEIVRRLDGLPLAIELAAGRARVLTPQAILDRLEQRLRLLTGGGRDREKRQQTLRDTIQWSYDLLSADEQALFGRLSVFVGGCRLEAAESVCDPEAELSFDIVDGVGSLVDRSLLRQRPDPDGRPRYWMLETIREFAHECLAARGDEQETARRHAAYFADSDAERDDVRRADEANRLAALEWLAANGERVDCARLAIRLTIDWADWGRPSVARRWLAEATDERVGDETVRAHALGWEAQVALQQGDVETARARAAEAIVLARETGASYVVGTALTALGKVATELGDARTAREAHEELLELATREGEPTWAAAALGNLAVLAIVGEDYVQAEEYGRRAVALYGEGSDGIGLALALLTCAAAASLAGARERAAASLSEALAIIGQVRSLALVPQALDVRAATALQSGDPLHAAELTHAATAIYEQLGMRRDPSARKLHAWVTCRLELHLGRSTSSSVGSVPWSLDEAIDAAMSTGPRSSLRERYGNDTPAVTRVDDARRSGS